MCAVKRLKDLWLHNFNKSKIYVENQRNGINVGVENNYNSNDCNNNHSLWTNEQKQSNIVVSILK
jgi:hypothetical protein